MDMTNDLGDFPTLTTPLWDQWLADTTLTDPLDDLAPWPPNEPAVFKTADAAAFARDIASPQPLPGSDVRARAITVSPEAIRKANDKLGCVFTVELTSGHHYTYRITRATARDDRDPPLFAWVFMGSTPENPWNYAYMGLVTDNLRFVCTKASKIFDDRRDALEEALQTITSGDLVDDGIVIAIANSGNCSVCGRMLTNAKSLATGIGPECTKKGEG
jgi:hypothetical protein